MAKIDEYAIAYDVALFCRLFEVFPDSFSASKTVTHHAFKPGAFGQEKVCTGTEEVTLASQILDTAKAIAHEGRDIDRAFRYLDFFKKARDQKKIIRKFYEN